MRGFVRERGFFFSPFKPSVITLYVCMCVHGGNRLGQLPQDVDEGAETGRAVPLSFLCTDTHINSEFHEIRSTGYIKTKSLY